MLDLIKALLPSICVGLLFWYVMRNIVRADRREREQIEKFYSEHERKIWVGGGGPLQLPICFT